MIYLADLTTLLLIVAILRWCFLPHSQLPRFRVRYLRLRLRLRLHPGRGHATVAELWLRWGRLAAFRRSRRSRPSLPAWARILIPDLHSVLLGRAQYGHGLRIGVEEHVLVMAPPRTGKSGLLARIVLRYRGPVVATTTKADVFALTSGIRSLSGPVEVFNPQGIGGVPSTFQWDPVQGCADEATAIRRADGFANAVGMSGTEDASFWVGKASSYLRALLHAAALVGGDMRLVAAWALGSAHEAEQILAEASSVQWALELAELRGEAYKTAATVRMVLTRALSFMTDQALARSVLPGDSSRFDIEAFLRGSGTLYLIAASDHDDSPVAPLFAVMAGEIHHAAVQQGQASPGQRLDPPLLFALDEVTQICPVPLPSWLADSGGKGVQVIPVSHGEAQLRTRWGSDGAQVVLDTCGVKVWLPGITDTATLRMAGELCGQASFTERVRYPGWARSEERREWHDVLTPDMIRQIPSGHALIVRGGYTPVIARLGAAWRDPAYRAARRRGAARAPLTPAGEPTVLADPGSAWPQRPDLPRDQSHQGSGWDPEAVGGIAEIPDYPEDLPW